MGRPAHLRPIEVWMKVKDASKLKRRRRDRHLTQVQLAALVGVTQQYISALETGGDQDCSQKVAEKIARWLDVDREDYFDARVVVSTPSITTDSRVDGNAA